ncbi:MAG TPA: FAD-binding oxidoreductase [Candidatus Tectomicrobia bacterium]|nr:FAD-binding oxidoreductase [Candidatus Tectomicrobia bacterium]
MTSTAPADVFSGALGADRIETADLARYEVDGLRPSCAVTPRSPEEAARALAAANGAGLAVIPFGAGTMMGFGNIPARYDVALDLRGLQRVIEYTPEDLTVTVEAGLRLSDVNALLTERGQFLPFDPPCGDHATIGGIVATNAAGPSRHQYDVPRDRLIGVTVALADGRLTKAGGRVVKNVAGYDLCKLYCGSMGTLGVIVAATFKVAPLPREEAVWVAPLPSVRDAFAVGFAALGRPLALRALELISPPLAVSAGLKRAWSVVAWCAGEPAAVARSLRELDSLAQGKARRDLDARRLTSWPADSAAVVLRLSLLPSDVQEALEGLPETAKASVTLAHGVARVGLDADHPELRARVERLGGTWALERAPLDLKRALDVWGPPPPAFAVMERLKREFDPRGTLSPGRFVGRL